MLIDENFVQRYHRLSFAHYVSHQFWRSGNPESGRSPFVAVTALAPAVSLGWVNTFVIGGALGVALDGEGQRRVRRPDAERNP